LNKKLVIRPLHPNDTPDLYEMITDPRVINTLIFVPSMEYQDEKSWVQNRKPGGHRFVAELDGKVVGSASINQNLRARTTHSGSFGLLVHSDYWGQGIGSALTAAALDLADNWLGLMRVELEVFADNPAAIHIYEKFGFEIEGTRRMAMFGGDGRFHDEHVMARLHNPPTNNQQPTVNNQKPTNKPTGKPTILIRPQRLEDVAAMHNILRHPMVARTTLQIPSLEYGAAVERFSDSASYRHRFVAEVDGRVVGSASLSARQNPRSKHCGGLGMMVHPDYWGMGIGSRLMAQLLDMADNWLNLQRVELEVNIDNPAAIHLYEKFGFEIEGTKRFQSIGDGRWVHSHFMARIRA
jgi:L-phenylalanine/L-methionine N-acetyltransferase